MSRKKYGAAATGAGQPDTGMTDIPFNTPPESGSWVTDYAWISGLVGALMVLLCAAFYNATNALGNGVYLFDIRLTSDRQDSILLALVVIASSMLVTEMIRLWRRDRKHFFVIDPALKAGRYGEFVLDSAIAWLLSLGVLGLAMQFFQTAGEYGYIQGNAYYRPWFRFIDLAFSAWLYGGLPYVMITRALKHDRIADRRDFASMAARILQFLASLIPGFKSFRPVFNEIDKKSARALLVKLFFTPLMTVFFTSQFPHLVSNIGYISGGMIVSIATGSYTHANFNNDLFNISIALVFSIDVALAWCGYVVSSRWVDNQTITAEPTMLGWVVCVFCYPPFQRYLGLYYGAPSEREVLAFPSHMATSIFTTMMVLSYIVYMSATLWFGVRFSNLTNRGIIRKGPYAFVRHPAYASKNFAWWCVMFPAVIYNAAHTGLRVAILQTLGLLFMTWFYYLRAITEERHLSADPYYQDYCRQVKYRFIPGVI